MTWAFIAAILMALGVALGAFGAHVLKDRFDAYSMGIWEKAVFYHFVHALGMLIVAALTRAAALSESAGASVSALLLAGIVLFSGSLYTLALSGLKVLGAVTPFGGVAFIAAWLMLAYHLLKASPK
ncbi:MAG TPA: DUF423 domain-containing protein [Bryobacteraceae bacterium]|nr:DUF423 domain-containing protein [Bryobacteraceae bacterium]